MAATENKGSKDGKGKVTEVDEKDIIKTYREKVAEGIKAGKMTIDDIERLMGEAIGQLTESVIAQTEEAIKQNAPSSDAGLCPDCGRPLKKTK